MSQDDHAVLRFRTLTAGLRVGYYEALDRIGCVAHAVTTRHGPDLRGKEKGDTGPLATVSAALGAEGFAYLKHVHGSEIVEVDEPGFAGEADGLITRRPGLALFAFAADCANILVADPVTGVVAAAHAGWRSTVERMAKKLMLAMIERCGSDPADIVACVGPTIGPCHFQANDEMIEAARRTMGPGADRFFPQRDGKTFFDLWAADEADLLEAGLAEENVHVSRICTICHNQDFFSYQHEREKSGRHGSAIVPKAP